MEEAVFLVQGSSPEPYKVKFTYNSGVLRAYCSCPAGENGQHCKHRLAILAGDKSAIIGENKKDILLIKSWLPGSALEMAIVTLMNAESEYGHAKKQLAAAKKNVAKAMKS